jgi:hypothetical protein
MSLLISSYSVWSMNFPRLEGGNCKGEEAPHSGHTLSNLGMSAWKTSTSSLCKPISTSWRGLVRRTECCRSERIRRPALPSLSIRSGPCTLAEDFRQPREIDNTTLTRDLFRAALAKLGLQDRILLKLDMTNHFVPVSCSASNG